MNILVVVDMQNDFISGALGTAEAKLIVNGVKERAENFEGLIFFTRDTHFEDYMNTQEGEKLPVPHCIKGTWGWEICDELKEISETTEICDKPTFGSVELMESIKELSLEEEIESITLLGLCTDICVISNAMLLKAALPETKIIVDGTLSAGVTPISHKNALEAMKMCQIEVIE
ncbi:MAG: cysteine hydrolase [Clostridia bacterium]|nr:cysteine hydrolase [Clostridia bacterium]